MVLFKLCASVACPGAEHSQAMAAFVLGRGQDGHGRAAGQNTRMQAARDHDNWDQVASISAAKSSNK